MPFKDYAKQLEYNKNHKRQQRKNRNNKRRKRSCASSIMPKSERSGRRDMSDMYLERNLIRDSAPA